MIQSGEAGISCANCGFEVLVKTAKDASALELELKWFKGDAVCPECKATTTFPGDGEIYEAASRRASPEAHAQIDALIASLPKERECCGTFPGSPHRATCANYRGKFKPSNACGQPAAQKK